MCSPVVSVLMSVQDCCRSGVGSSTYVLLKFDLLQRYWGFFKNRHCTSSHAGGPTLSPHVAFLSETGQVMWATRPPDAYQGKLSQSLVTGVGPLPAQGTAKIYDCNLV